MLKNKDFGESLTWVYILAVLTDSFVTSESAELSELSFFNYKMGIIVPHRIVISLNKTVSKWLAYLSISYIL